MLRCKYLSKVSFYQFLFFIFFLCQSSRDHLNASESIVLRA